jgi:hypothetical protein
MGDRPVARSVIILENTNTAEIQTRLFPECQTHDPNIRVTRQCADRGLEGGCELD